MSALTAATAVAEGRGDGKSPYIKSAEAAAMLGWHRHTVALAVRQGRLRAGRVGSRLRIVRSSVEKLLAQLPAEGDQEPPEPPAVERALALLPELTPAERKRLALAAIDGLEVA